LKRVAMFKIASVNGVLYMNKREPITDSIRGWK